jgi:hypothetical protein
MLRHQPLQRRLPPDGIRIRRHAPLTSLHLLDEKSAPFDDSGAPDFLDRPARTGRGGSYWMAEVKRP